MYYNVFVQLKSYVSQRQTNKTNRQQTHKDNNIGVKSSTELRVENLFILLAHSVLKMC